MLHSPTIALPSRLTIGQSLTSLSLSRIVLWCSGSRPYRNLTASRSSRTRYISRVLRGSGTRPCCHYASLPALPGCSVDRTPPDPDVRGLRSPDILQLGKDNLGGFAGCVTYYLFTDLQRGPPPCLRKVVLDSSSGLSIEAGLFYMGSQAL